MVTASKPYYAGGKPPTTAGERRAAARAAYERGQKGLAEKRGTKWRSKKETKEKEAKKGEETGRTITLRRTGQPYQRAKAAAHEREQARKARGKEREPVELKVAEDKPVTQKEKIVARAKQQAQEVQMTTAPRGTMIEREEVVGVTGSRLAEGTVGYAAARARAEQITEQTGRSTRVQVTGEKERQGWIRTQYMPSPQELKALKETGTVTVQATRGTVRTELKREGEEPVVDIQRAGVDQQFPEDKTIQVLKEAGYKITKVGDTVVGTKKHYDVETTQLTEPSKFTILQYSPEAKMFQKGEERAKKIEQLPVIKQVRDIRAGMREKAAARVEERGYPMGEEGALAVLEGAAAPVTLPVSVAETTLKTGGKIATIYGEGVHRPKVLASATEIERKARARITGEAREAAVTYVKEHPAEAATIAASIGLTIAVAAGTSGAVADKIPALQSTSTEMAKGKVVAETTKKGATIQVIDTKGVGVAHKLGIRSPFKVTGTTEIQQLAKPIPTGTPDVAIAARAGGQYTVTQEVPKMFGLAGKKTITYPASAKELIGGVEIGKSTMVVTPTGATYVPYTVKIGQAVRTPLILTEKGVTQAGQLQYVHITKQFTETGVWGGGGMSKTILETPDATTTFGVTYTKPAGGGLAAPRHTARGFSTVEAMTTTSPEYTGITSIPPTVTVTGRTQTVAATGQQAVLDTLGAKAAQKLAEQQLVDTATLGLGATAVKTTTTITKKATTTRSATAKMETQTKMLEKQFTAPEIEQIPLVKPKPAQLVIPQVETVTTTKTAVSVTPILKTRQARAPLTTTTTIPVSTTAQEPILEPVVEPVMETVTLPAMGTPAPTVTTPFFTPPTVPLFPLLPSLPRGWSAGKAMDFKALKRPKGYQPSVSATLLGITSTAKPKKGQLWSGAEIRPILLPKKKKRRLK